mmetsp:Transcript_25492/g.55444  ORF Transcript_25492/g.55444 Transcript_25492/m.55444 type:complete len:221 (-) Transcript_25492:107-769(-)
MATPTLAMSQALAPAPASALPLVQPSRTPPQKAEVAAGGASSAAAAATTRTAMAMATAATAVRLLQYPSTSPVLYRVARSLLQLWTAHSGFMVGTPPPAARGSCWCAVRCWSTAVLWQAEHRPQQRARRAGLLPCLCAVARSPLQHPQLQRSVRMRTSRSTTVSARETKRRRTRRRRRRLRRRHHLPSARASRCPAATRTSRRIIRRSPRRWRWRRRISR